MKYLFQVVQFMPTLDHRVVEFPTAEKLIFRGHNIYRNPVLFHSNNTNTNTNTNIGSNHDYAKLWLLTVSMS